MTIEMRVARLERTNRRLALGLGLAMLAVVLMAAKAPPKVVTAQRFIVQDSAGVERAVFGVGHRQLPETTAAVRFWKKDGSLAIDIGVDEKDQGDIAIMGPAKSFVGMAATKDLGTYVQVVDKTGRTTFSSP